uniref:Uncharacterized protein n=1 Tax=Spongospora subterranea TaxID=70186 RepID=A0A0H5QKV7_9EUKA|eukprot:CRZ01966.1 hypothetical protein [Spongospora subterranea]
MDPKMRILDMFCQTDGREGSVTHCVDSFTGQPCDEECGKRAFFAQEEKSKESLKRTRLAQELLRSEQTYVKLIEVLTGMFVIPLESRIKELSPALADLFRNAQVIAGLNRKFLDELSSRMDRWSECQKIGDVFLAFAPFLRMYCSYAIQHEDGNRMLYELRQKGDSIVKTIAGLEAAPECKGNTLESFLILPVQRLPRYQLIFNELSLSTPVDHPDYADIQKAFLQASAVSVQINEAIRDREMSSNILELQNRFIGDVTLLTPSRRLIRTGSLTKVCRSKKQVREFFLFNDLLVYARNAPGTSHGLLLNRQIPIDSSFEVLDAPSTGLKFPFEIRSRIKSFTVLAPSHTDKVEWLLRIIDCMQEFQGRTTRSSSTVTSTNAAPIWQPNDFSNHCAVCRVHFSLFRRRHHCRRCGALVCSGCSRFRATLDAIAGSVDRICSSCASNFLVTVSPASTTSRGDYRRQSSDTESPASGTLHVKTPSCDKLKPGNHISDSPDSSLLRSRNEQSFQSDCALYENSAVEEKRNVFCDKRASSQSVLAHEAAKFLTRKSRSVIKPRLSTSPSSHPSMSVMYSRANVLHNSNNVNELQFEIHDLIAGEELQVDGWCWGKNIRTSEKGWFVLEETTPLNHASGYQQGCPSVAILEFLHLSFQIGELVTVLERYPSGWWKGQVGSTIGVFASSCVGDSEESVVAATEISDATSMISFSIGDIVEVTDTRSEIWWSGFLKTGDFGWFPANYVKLGVLFNLFYFITYTDCLMCSSI